MAEIKEPQKVKLIIGLIAKKEYLKATIDMLIRKFGPVDFKSDIFEFKHTDYYYKEMGRPLYRHFVSFKKLISPDYLWKIKVYTNKEERKFLEKGKRQVNIDPGYLDFSKLVLASAKDFSHRIYLNKGIYAEITLIYREGEYRAVEWTFPDYACLSYREIFRQIRGIYESQIRKGKNIS